MATTATRSTRRQAALTASPRAQKSAVTVASATCSIPIWDLPEVLIFHIVSFVAPPTHRANILCHHIAPLCQAARKVVLDSERSIALWDAVLVGDYGINQKLNSGSQERRSCKRLRRSPCHQVRDAHRLLKDNTEIAFFYLSELAHSSPTCKNNKSLKGALTKCKLCSILEEYGAHLRINQCVSSGGTYLVEVCRARNVKENTILKCVEELVENRGALPNVSTMEANNSQLTALCVASVRGMPTVVQYLLRHGASADLKCSGRFRLGTNSRKSVRCTQSTPLEFSQIMLASELEHGASNSSVSNLRKCITLLSE